MATASDPEPIRIPVDEGTSVYANDFAVWISGHDAALDLYVLGPTEDGERPAFPVGRVRLPGTMLKPMCFALIDAFQRLDPEGDRS